MLLMKLRLLAASQAMSSNTFADCYASSEKYFIHFSVRVKASVISLQLPSKPGSPDSQARPAKGPGHTPARLQPRASPLSPWGSCSLLAGKEWLTRPALVRPSPWPLHPASARCQAKRSQGAPGAMRGGAGRTPRGAGLQRLAQLPRAPANAAAERGAGS